MEIKRRFISYYVVLYSAAHKKPVKMSKNKHKGN